MDEDEDDFLKDEDWGEVDKYGVYVGVWGER